LEEICAKLSAGFRAVRGRSTFISGMYRRARRRVHSQMADMDRRLTLHVVDSDSRSRAEQARIAFALGHHAEVYSDLTELVERAPDGGIVLLSERTIEVPFGELVERLDEQGVWLPLIVCAEAPEIENVVAAIKNGVLDYLGLPLEAGRLARSLARVSAEADAQGRARQHLAESRRRVALLSKREREVLELLALGGSNKLIARELSISPRTVEIHRSKMMTKLRAGHAAEAVRLWLQSGLEAELPDLPAEREPDEGRGLSSESGFGRAVRERLPEAIDEDGGEREATARGTKRG
jgi:FixJ family two-component response regulator